MSHTPGLWEADIEDDHDSEDPIPILVKGAEIASVHGHGIFPCFDEESPSWDKFPAEQIANARLIAAAPDLLEAIERFIDINYTRGYEFDSNEPVVWMSLIDAVSKAKDANDG